MRIILLWTCLICIIPLVADKEFSDPSASSKKSIKSTINILIGNRASCYDHKGRGYYFIREPKTFSSADDYCKQNKLQFVRIFDKEHNDWLKSKVKEFESDMKWWIGLKDTHTGRRNFEWNTKDNIKYENWEAGMPSNDRSLTGVAMIADGVDGLWITVNKGDLLYSICEAQGLSCKPDECLEVCGRKYYFVDKRRNYFDAKSYCKYLGGYLATIANNFCNKELSDKAYRIASGVSKWYIGLVDIGHSDPEWQDGQKSKFTDLNVYRLNNKNGHSCIILTKNFWRYDDCSSLRNFICQSSSSCPNFDGNWGSWSEWTACSKSCGNGDKSRRRSCDNPKPQHTGKDCDGKSSETETCTLRHCPIDGGWSEWDYWSPCSRTCGGSTHSRFRECNNPLPQHGGLECMGRFLETRGCGPPLCSIMMKLENVDEQKLHNNSAFYTGDVIQCSPSIIGIMKYVWINVSCENYHHCENCTENELPCQTYLDTPNSSIERCTLTCSGIFKDSDVKFEVISDNVSIVWDDKIRLKLEEVNPVNDGNLRESDYDIKCIANRIDQIKVLYINQNCTGFDIKTEYCDRSNCQMKISVNNISHCNISCHAHFYDSTNYNNLIIDWKIICITPQWSEWSDCSETCDSGWQTRERTCIRSVYNHDSDLPCYEADSRECVTDNKCDIPNEDPPLYFKPRKPRKATSQHLFDITPSGPPP